MSQILVYFNFRKTQLVLNYLVRPSNVAIRQLYDAMKQRTQLTVYQRREFSLYKLLQILVVFGFKQLGEMVKNLVKSDKFTQIVIDVV